jgi:TonB-dependent receptor
VAFALVCTLCASRLFAQADNTAEPGKKKSPPAVAPTEPIQVLEKFVLQEKKEGAEAKFSDKTGAEAVTEVVSGEALKNPNAQNSSDLLKNTSGVTVSAGTNGSSNVSVRGIDQRMLRITVDGQRQGGTGNALDNIPPEIVQSLEVTKTFTPDMEADAVGGVINVNTGGTVIKNGYEQGRHQLTYNPFDPRPGTRNSLTIARPFHLFTAASALAKPGAKAVAPNASVSVTASFDDSYKARERLSTLREWTAQRSPGPAPFTGQEIPVLTLPLIESTMEHRQRTGLVVNSDARFGDLSLFWRSNFNRDWARRNRDFNDTNPAAGTVLSLTPTSGVFGGVAQSRRNQHQISQRDAGNLSFGGKGRLGRTDIDATFGYSLTSEDEPRTLETVFLSDHTYRTTYDLAANAFIPEYSAIDETNPADTTSINDSAYYHFNYLTVTRTDTRDEEASAKFNAKINLADDAKSGNYLKFGGKVQRRHRTANTDRAVYNPGSLARDMTGLVGTRFVTMETVGYHFGPVANAEAVTSLLTTTPAVFEQNPTQSLINSNGGDYSITESVWAAYAMARVKLLDRWTLLGGVRVEGTSVTSKASQMEFDASGKFLGFTPAHAENNYTEVLPGLHLRYDPAPGMLYRASITRSLSRPAYTDIPPFRTLSFIDHRSRAGAPDLKPYQSTNFDLSLDQYSESSGLFSYAVFYKKIDHFITDAQYPVTIGNLGQFIEFKRVNGETAYAMGFEANWQSRTWELPAGLGRGSIEANYSFNHGEAHHPTRPGETFPLPRQVDHQAALKLHGERGAFSLDASMRYRTGWWEDLIAPGFDNYIKAVWDAELGAVYKIGKNTRVTVGVNNLLNVPTRHYAGVTTRMNDYQLSGIDYSAGVQWKL